MARALLHESTLVAQISHKDSKSLRKIQRKLHTASPVAGQVCGNLQVGSY
jgi:hypothetical protein